MFKCRLAEVAALEVATPLPPDSAASRLAGVRDAGVRDAAVVSSSSKSTASLLWKLHIPYQLELEYLA